MPAVSITLFQTPVSEGVASADSTRIALTFNDLNHDDIINSTEWQSQTGNLSGQIPGDIGPVSLWDGDTESRDSSRTGTLYTSTPLRGGDSVSALIENTRLSNDRPTVAALNVCFLAGTMIETPSGEVPVETLRPGDMVLTRDHGALPLVWTHATRVTPGHLDLAPNKRPVRIEAGQVVEQSFEVTFELPGKHRVEVTLPGDSLSADNTRHLAVEVAPANRVLVIEGDPSDQEGIFPSLALAANPQASGYQTVVASSDYLYRNNIDDFQSILMLNVPELTPDAIESLEAFVRGGGGLVWYAGDAINPASYNSLLYAEGAGLFPVPLGDAPRELLRDNVAAPGPDLELTDHPMLAGLQGQENPEIEATRIFRFFPVTDEWQKDDRRREDSVTTIARLRTRDPLLLEHRFGRGRVITCLTSCGPSWTNFPQYRSFVPFHFELQKYISRSDRVLPQLESGAPIHLELDPSRFGPSVRIEPPRNSGQVTVEMQVQAGSVQTAPAGSGSGGSQEGGAGTKAGDKTGDKTGTGAAGVTQSDATPTLRRVVDYDRTDYPGVYRVRLVADEVNVERWFAYNTGRDEGRLALVETSAIRKSLGPGLADGVRIQEAGSTEWLSGEESDRDVREWILGLLILLLLAEQVMAYRLSFHPSRAMASGGAA